MRNDKNICLCLNIENNFLFQDNVEPKYIAAGSGNAVQLSRFFDKVRIQLSKFNVDREM